MSDYPRLYGNITYLCGPRGTGRSRAIEVRLNRYSPNGTLMSIKFGDGKYEWKGVGFFFDEYTILDEIPDTASPY